MLKESETEETIGFIVTFLSLVAVQLGVARVLWAPICLRQWVRDEVIGISARSQIGIA